MERAHAPAYDPQVKPPPDEPCAQSAQPGEPDELEELEALVRKAEYF